MSTEDKEIDRGDDVVAEDETTAEAETTEEEVTAEAEAESPTEEEPETEEEPKAAKEQLLPKSRYDFQAARRKEAERRAEEAERKIIDLEAKLSGDGQKSSGVTDDTSTLYKQLEEARQDGDVDKAIDIGEQIRKAELEAVKAETKQYADQVAKTSTEQVRLDSTISALEEAYDVLNPDSDSYQENVVGDVLELHEAYLSTGKYTSSDAMLRAVSRIIPETSVEETPTQTSRKVTNIKKNVDAANRVPPTTKGVGLDSDKAGLKEDVDVSKLSDQELFDALPESKLKQLRGDFG